MYVHHHVVWRERERERERELAIMLSIRRNSDTYNGNIVSDFSAVMKHPAWHQCMYGQSNHKNVWCYHTIKIMFVCLSVSNGRSAETS